MKAKVYLTDAQKNRLTLQGEFEMKFANTDIQTEVSHKDDVEAFLINIHPEVEFGEVSGIGGSINDTTACVWDSMPEDKKQEFVKAVPAENTPLLVDKSQRNAVTTEYTLDESVSAPVSRGQKLGTMCVKVGEQVIAQLPLVAEATVEKLTWSDLALQFFKHLTMSK
jgi:hypothetical protein